jgi:hypothetical protein
MISAQNHLQQLSGNNYSCHYGLYIIVIVKKVVTLPFSFRAMLFLEKWRMRHWHQKAYRHQVFLIHIC